MKEEPKERRRFKRADFPCKVYVLTAPLHVIECKTENIGAGGIRIIIDEELPLSSLVGLKLYLSQEPIESKGKIVWVVERKGIEGKTGFDTGIEFHDISQSDQKTIDIFVKSLVN